MVSKAYPEVRLFGGCAVVVDGHTIGLGGPKPRAVFARLAWDCGRVVSTDALVEDVWGEDPPARVRASLQMHVTTLRRALSSAGASQLIVTRAPGYLLDLPPSAVDILRFADLVRSVARSGQDSEALRLERAEHAFRLWEGSPMLGLEEAPFVDRAIRWCEKRRNDLVEAVGWSVATTQEAAAFLPLVEPIVDQHPLDGPLHAARARLLHSAGRTRDALLSIAQLRSRLWDETGLAAGDTLDSLEQSLLDRAEAGPEQPSQAVASISGFDADIARIERASTRSRIVTVCGSFGSGAGELVEAFAGRARASGQVVVDLHDAIGSRVASGQLVVGDVTDLEPDHLARLVAGLPDVPAVLAAFVPFGVEGEEAIWSEPGDHDLLDTIGGGRELERRIAEACRRLDPEARALLEVSAHVECWFDECDAERLSPRLRSAFPSGVEALRTLAGRGLLEIDLDRTGWFRVPALVRRVILGSASPAGARERAAVVMALKARAGASAIGTPREAAAIEWFDRSLPALERVAADDTIPIKTRRTVTRSLVHSLLATGRATAAWMLLTGLGADVSSTEADLVAMASTAAALDEYAFVDQCLRRMDALGGEIDQELTFVRVRTLRHRCNFALAHEVLGRLPDTEDPAEIASRNLELGMVLAMEARTDEARERLAIARRSFDTLLIERAIGACWAYSAWCDLVDGRVARAREGLGRATAVSVRLSHRADQAFVEVLEGHAFRLNGMHDQAYTLGRSASEFFESARDRLGLARALELLADVGARQAATHSARAARLRDEIGAPRSPLESLLLTRTS